MTTKVVPGMLLAGNDAREAAEQAGARMARILKQAQGAHGRATLALSGGTTPKAAYSELSRSGAVDWKRVDIFFVDERAVPPDDARSNFRMVQEALLQPAHVPAANVYRMPADGSDLAAAARDYAAMVDQRVEKADGFPSFDLIVFGVGADGHTASLFPGDPTLSITDRWVADVAANAEQKREARLTLTVPVLEHARNALVLAVGVEKRDALQRAWAASGDRSETPARIIRGVRGSIVWVIDRAAGGL